MRHVPFFRWVLTLGVLFIACSAAVYVAVPEMPELRQIDLTVLDEKPDGTCTVRWTDPFDRSEHEAAHQCDARRADSLKAPYYDPETGYGWETGFVVAEGSAKGRLYTLGQDDKDIDDRIDLSDTLLIIGLLLTTAGLIGGNIRAAARLIGARPDVVHRAWRLAHDAAAVEEDHTRAIEAVRAAWAPLQRERVHEEMSRTPVKLLRNEDKQRFRTKAWEKGGIHTARDVLDAGVWKLGQLPDVGRRTAEQAVAAAERLADAAHQNVLVRLTPDDRSDPRTTSLITALRVLVEAGPQAQEAADTARELAVRLEPLLTGASAASTRTGMLRVGPEGRRRTRAAVAELRGLLAEAKFDALGPRFGQTSVDLLRGPDNELDALSAWTDFESRPADYYRVLAEVTAGSAGPPAGWRAPSPGGGLSGEV
ncbi:hypothetical protein E6P78_15700 [Streptomyces sp. A0958]|uniref:hypothetical protein n=1 Tax=Streptomyces sp. A0958 TaxID=2563101 RepID=UPI00109E4F24|nr:hypothetical protein [Streptomyces sp. A0958]THA67087.1 hypothetical protein E6P78_15700 [Streptomyces sp. A0958]